MESFKKALKQAIVDKAEAVLFEAGQMPLLYASPERQLTQLGAMDKASLQALIDSLLPAQATLNLSVREGNISIVNFGELKLLATNRDPLKLYAFIPPKGNSFYLEIKSMLTQDTPKTPARMVDLPPDEFAGVDTVTQRGQFSMSHNTNQTGNPHAQRVDEATVHSQSSDDLQFKTAYMSKPSEGDARPVVPDLPGLQSDQILTPLPIPMPRPFHMHTNAALENGAGEAPDAPSAASTDLGARPRPLEAVPNGSDAWLQTTPRAFAAESLTSTQGGSDEVDDYHFDQSIHSGMRAHQDGTETTSASPTTQAAQASNPAPSPLLSPAPSTIYFGATIPGETIVRSGRFPIDELLEDMVKRRASDLHLTLGEPICFRIDGEIVRGPEHRLDEATMRSYLLPIMPPRNREEFATINDTDFAYELPGVARFRVNIFRDRVGVGAVMRQIPDKVLSADDLGLSPAIRKLCELHKGLVIVTGPTGSGKSTTLAAMIDLINESRTDHILTIEDPIEFVHKQKRCLINQREVHKHTGSFARALKAALREDPDIILIGEMRDLETVAIAIETAETGHLVFGTLHTNTAISTVDRLIDQFPADQQEQVRVMLAESLKGVVSQTLIKKKGGGRVAAQEILLVDKAVSSLIREGNTHMMQNHMQTQKAKGNVQLNDALLHLVVKGIIDPKDAYMKAIEKEALLSMLQGKGFTLEQGKSAS